MAADWCSYNITQDHNIASKENEKVNKYIGLASVITTEDKVKTEIIPLVIRVLDSVCKQLKTHIDVVGIPNMIDIAQIFTITKTAIILRDAWSL